MQHRDREGLPRALPRCTSCDDVIGVYEPLVHRCGEFVRRTSRAVEPGVVACEGECYHLGCYERVVDES